MKTIKRVISVLLLIVLMAVVGYIVFTANRLPSIQEQTQVSNQEASIWTNAEYLT